MTTRSQGLKAQEKGNTNPCRLKCHCSRSAAERPVDCRLQRVRGMGKREERKEIRRRKRQVKIQVEEWGDVVEIRSSRDEWSVQNDTAERDEKMELKVKRAE